MQTCKDYRLWINAIYDNERIIGSSSHPDWNMNMHFWRHWLSKCETLIIARSGTAKTKLTTYGHGLTHGPIFQRKKTKSYSLPCGCTIMIYTCLRSALWWAALILQAHHNLGNLGHTLWQCCLLLKFGTLFNRHRGSEWRSVFVVISWSPIGFTVKNASIKNSLNGPGLEMVGPIWYRWSQCSTIYS